MARTIGKGTEVYNGEFDALGAPPPPAAWVSPPRFIRINDTSGYVPDEQAILPQGVGPGGGGQPLPVSIHGAEVPCAEFPYFPAASLFIAPSPTSSDLDGKEGEGKGACKGA